MNKPVCAALVALLAACGGKSDPSPAGGVEGLALLERLAGLWSGPVTSYTSVPSFSPMNVDFRQMTGGLFWGRFDADPDNALRFAFAVEQQDGAGLFIYRNGGFFQGMLRDDRTMLVEHSADTWRFCSVSRGCDYIDASYTFASASQLVFDVKVKRIADPAKQQHILWQATRLETRSAPSLDTTPLSPDAPLPAMPALHVTASWSSALPADTDVWVVLSVQDCPAVGVCAFSRITHAVAGAGATSVQLDLPEIHSGSYKLNAFLDRDGNAQPSSGDRIVAPINQAIAVASTGVTSFPVSLNYDVP